MATEAIVNAYSRSQYGGDLPYFVGKQYGRGWLRTLARVAFPILKRVGRVAAKTAQDVIEGEKKILPSLYENTMEEISGSLKRPTAPPRKRGVTKRKRPRLGRGLAQL